MREQTSDTTPQTAPIIDSLASLVMLVGQEFCSANWMLITQERVQAFAEVTEDRQWIHLDPERARRESPFQTAIAHGFLTLSLLSHFLEDAMEVRGGSFFAVNYGLGKVRFPAPVRVGGRIRARFLLRSVAEIPGGLHAVYDTTVEIQGASKPCCVAEWLMRYYTVS